MSSSSSSSSSNSFGGSSSTPPPTSSSRRRRLVLDSHSEEPNDDDDDHDDDDNDDDKEHDLLRSNDDNNNNTNTNHHNNNDDHPPPSLVAPFHRDEIQVGALLGEGTFSCVYEVTGFVLRDDNHHDNNHDDDNNSSHDALDRHCQKLRHEVVSAPPGRYALKHLKPSFFTTTTTNHNHSNTPTSCTQDFEDAATDIVMEAKYLAALQHHPGILSLRGSPWEGTAAFCSPNGGGYFLLTDRLAETLQQRIERWKNRGDDDETNTVVCKIHYARQIAEALRYLHEQRILFRDLKPSNLGFTLSPPKDSPSPPQQQHDRIQLFDFGLCRELPPACRARPYHYVPYVVGREHDPTTTTTEEDDDDECSVDMDESWQEKCDEKECFGSQHQHQQQSSETTTTPLPQREQVFLMSGAGTQIYMGVEILLNHRYNLKTDVYSWSMTVAEMFLLESPLPLYSMEDHIQYVCREGDRPVLDETDVPAALQDLLEWAWVGDVSQRCDMAQVCEELEDILGHVQALQDNDDDDEAIITPHPTVSRVRQCLADALSWSNLCRAAGRMQAVAWSVLDTTLRNVRSFFRHRDNDDDASSSATTAPNDSTLALEKATTASSDEDSPRPPRKQDRGQLEDSNAPPQPPQTSPPLQANNRDSLLKRKASSASTTVMTDDECDDDDLLLPSVGSHPYLSGLEAVAEKR